MEIKPHRLGIILVGKELNSPALKLLILGMNRIQTHFEYELFPEPTDDQLLNELTRSRTLDRRTIRGLAIGFPDRFKPALAQRIKAYEPTDARVPDYFVVVSLARFADNYFNLREQGITVMGLRNWRRSMAPPSLLEFVQALIVRESVSSVCPALRGSIHLGAKGCICDFSPSLQDVRLKVLSGFLCSYCRNELEIAGLPLLATEVQYVLSNKWLGDLRRPASLASTLAKFGVDLFGTKGLTPTLWEKTIKMLQEDGIKELLKVIYAIILAGLIFYLGWKGGP